MAETIPKTIELDKTPFGTLVPCEIDFIFDQDGNKHLVENNVPELYGFYKKTLTVVALASDVKLGNDYSVVFRDGLKYTARCIYASDQDNPNVPSIFSGDLSEEESSENPPLITEVLLPQTKTNQQIPCNITAISDSKKVNHLLVTNSPNYYSYIKNKNKLVVLAFASGLQNKVNYRVDFPGYNSCLMTVQYTGDGAKAPAILTGTYPSP